MLGCGSVIHESKHVCVWGGGGHMSGCGSVIHEGKHVWEGGRGIIC